MIELTARLTRGAVYFAGEALECWITLRNVAPAGTPSSPVELDKTSNAQNGRKESSAVESISIAFVSGQIHCQCSVEESKVTIQARPPLLDRNDVTGRRASTAGLAEQNAFCLTSTVPKLLVGNLNLQIGEEFNVLYSEIIPRSSYPSFRGSSVRYSWKLALGCQILGRDTTVIHIPLYVLLIKDVDYFLPITEQENLHETTEEASNHVDGQTNGSVLNGTTPRQNGINHSVTSHGPPQILSIESAMEMLDNLTSRRNLITYNIESSQGKVGLLQLSKTRFRLGEDIVGKFNFSDRKMTCVQYLVSLIGEEIISEENRKGKTPASTESIVSKVHDFCLCLERTNFVLPIPLYITPSFKSEIVELKWKLRMEFSLSNELLQTDVPSVGLDQQSVLWRPPLRVPVETLVWDIPIEIFPADPVQIHSVHLRDSLGTDVRITL